MKDIESEGCTLAETTCTLAGVLSFLGAELQPGAGIWATWRWYLSASLLYMCLSNSSKTTDCERMRHVPCPSMSHGVSETPSCRAVFPFLLAGVTGETLKDTCFREKSHCWPRL